MQFQDCKGHFPLYTLEGLLPAQFRDESGFHEALLCLKCRRKAFKFIKEPYPYQVAAYSDSIVGVTIIPRITGSEAKLQYGVHDSILELLPHGNARFVSSAGEICKTKMYEEREILERARWILNARRVLALLGERIEHPPAGAIRERRNFIRQMSLKQDIFAAPELPSVRRFVEHGQGDLHQIANFYEIYTPFCQKI